MSGGFIAFRCSNYDTTPEREQYRLLCKKMKAKYAKSEQFYLLVGNYNIYDSELDAIVIKHDSIIAVEFKNYGGTIVATENGDWTANGVPINVGMFFIQSLLIPKSIKPFLSAAWLILAC